MAMKIATVAVEKTYFNYESDYDYCVPPQLTGRVQVGSRVQVCFGNANAVRSGFVIALREEEIPSLKPIDVLLDEQPFLTDEMVSLALWMKERTFTTTYDCLKAMLPRGLGLIHDATVRMVRLLSGFDPETLTTKKQRLVVELLEEAGSAGVKEICQLIGVTESVIHTLEKKQVVSFFDHVVYRKPVSNLQVAAVSGVSLTVEQAEACEVLKKAVDAGAFSTALLFGVTGSGKTQVFLHTIDHVLSLGRNVIVLVPEIALTPQTMAIFYERYGETVAVFHSALSLGERSDAYKKVRAGKARIVIGTRSAVFAPLSNIGLIVMDEEQEHTYKSESSPRYHARDVAKYRCAYHKALLLLASATPSIETYSAAINGRYLLCRLNKRYGGAVLPQVLTVDMKRELQKKEASGNAISSVLYDGLRENLKKGQQSILLMNRRGYNTFVACNSCGHVVTCPNCSISLTYHSSENSLMCHYCGYTEPLRRVCPECGSEAVRYSGFGTQRIEEELQQNLPQARILRMDADTTTERFSHERKLAGFSSGAFDILLGTQMVAKGLDFPNVTLVGIVNADNALYNESYTAGERAFSLLTQVIGRSGRGIKEGRAVIQTITPENPVIELAAKQDYPSFYDMEIRLRKLMIYPPYCDIFVIGFSCGKEALAASCAAAFFHELVEANKIAQHKLILLGPSPAKVAKVNGKYRYRLIMKCKNTASIRAFIKQLLIGNSKKKEFKPVSVYVDLNPDDLI